MRLTRRWSAPSRRSHRQKRTNLRFNTVTDLQKMAANFHVERKEDGRMSFRKYIAEMKLSRTHFAIDAQEDKDLPDAMTWEELEAYLVAKHCPQEVIED